MRKLLVLGCVVSASTANAQPTGSLDAPPSAPSPAAGPAPGAPSPPAAGPEPSAPSPTTAVPEPTAAVPAPATAVPEPAEPAARLETEKYGWQIVISDAASVALALNMNPASVGAFAYVFGGPTIHGIHGEPGRAFASMALRIALPLASGYAWAALTQSRSSCVADDNDCDTGAAVGGVFGFGLGVSAAMVLDATLLARSSRPRSKIATS